MDKLELFKYLKDVYFFELERRRKSKTTLVLETFPIAIIFFVFSLVFIVMIKYDFYFSVPSVVNVAIFMFLIFYPIVISTDIPMTYMWHNKEMEGVDIVTYNSEFLKLNPNNESLVSDAMLDLALVNIQQAISDNHNGTNIIIEKGNKLKSYAPFFYLFIVIDFFFFLSSFSLFIGKF